MASLRGLLLLGTLLLSSAVRADDRTCYYPNGDESGDVPCSDSENTHCCGRYGICLTNGFCINTSGKPYSLSRGSCTDPDWGSSCPTQCTDTPYDGTGVTVGLIKEVLGSWSSYCCGTAEVDGDDLACKNNLTAFTIEHGEMIFGYAGLANATEISSSTSSGTSSSSATASSSPGETTEISSSVVSSSDSKAATGTSSSSSSGSSDGSTSGSSGDSSTAVGAGVGASLGAALAGALAWGFWERRKRFHERKAMVEVRGMGPADGKSPLYTGHYINSSPQAPYAAQPAYPAQPPYPPQASHPVQAIYSPPPVHMQPQFAREMPHHNPAAVEMMDNPRQ